jgi:hypothetical protein
VIRIQNYNDSRSRPSLFQFQLCYFGQEKELVHVFGRRFFYLTKSRCGIKCHESQYHCYKQWHSRTFANPIHQICSDRNARSRFHRFRSAIPRRRRVGRSNFWSACPIAPWQAQFTFFPADPAETKVRCPNARCLQRQLGPGLSHRARSDHGHGPSRRFPALRSPMGETTRCSMSSRL